MKENANATVRFSLEADQLPPLTEAQQAELAALAAMPDDTIDYSDAPELTDAFWQAAERPVPTKQQVTLRIDADVLDFFRSAGRRYQTRINSILRAYVEAQREKHTHGHG